MREFWGEFIDSFGEGKVISRAYVRYLPANDDDDDSGDNGNDNDGNGKVPSTSWSLLPMSSVEQTTEAQLQLSLPKVLL